MAYKKLIKIYALKKIIEDILSIAVGSIIRRLVAKICCLQDLKSLLEEKLRPVQFGLAMQLEDTSSNINSLNKKHFLQRTGRI